MLEAAAVAVLTVVVAAARREGGGVGGGGRISFAQNSSSDTDGLINVYEWSILAVAAHHDLSTHCPSLPLFLKPASKTGLLITRSMVNVPHTIIHSLHKN